LNQLQNVKQLANERSSKMKENHQKELLLVLKTLEGLIPQQVSQVKDSLLVPGDESVQEELAILFSKLQAASAQMSSAAQPNNFNKKMRSALETIKSEISSALHEANSGSINFFICKFFSVYCKFFHLINFHIYLTLKNIMEHIIFFF
jgi:hypothetical protein